MVNGGTMFWMGMVLGLLMGVLISGLLAYGCCRKLAGALYPLAAIFSGEGGEEVELEEQPAPELGEGASPGRINLGPNRFN